MMVMIRFNAMWFRNSLFCFLLFISPVTHLYTAHAGQPLIYYILDGSGSMWGRVEGQAKIAVARETLTRLIQETPDGVNVGLCVYGVRRQGDCKDIEEIIPPGTPDRKKAAEGIGKIIPKGKTPLADSIAFAAERIKEKGFNTTVVLISDGLETCGKDPCAVTKALRESGLKFVMHVVGFGVKEEERGQLACIAKEGEGQLFQAGNAMELFNTLKQIKESAVSQTPLPTPPAVLPEEEPKTAAASVRVKAKGPGKIKLILPSWARKPNYWRLLDPETGEEKGRFMSLDEQMVPAGAYQIAWRETEHGSTEVVLGEVVSVESGKASEVLLKTAIRLVPAEWVDKKYYYWMLRDLHSRNEVVRFKGEGFESHLVPAGIYQIIFRQSEHGHGESVLGEINIADNASTEFSLNSGIRLIPPEKLAPPYRVQFVSLDEKDDKGRPLSVTISGSFGPVLLKPGRYKVIYHQVEHGSSPMTILEDLVVDSGSLVEIEL
jgi:hypothetical protein